MGIKWLEGGEVLFAGGVEARLNVCPSFGLDLDAYAMGYREAAQILFKALVKARGNAHHSLLFPIAFLWRQYLELTLKSLAQKVQASEGEDWKLEQGHRLSAIWNRLRPYFEKYWPKLPEHKWTARLIADFERMDPGSQDFRYPIRRNGKRSLGNAPECVNLRVLNDSMEKLANALDGAADAIQDGLDARPSLSDFY